MLLLTILYVPPSSQGDIHEIHLIMQQFCSKSARVFLMGSQIKTPNPYKDLKAQVIQSLIKSLMSSLTSFCLICSAPATPTSLLYPCQACSFFQTFALSVISLGMALSIESQIYSHPFQVFAQYVTFLPKPPLTLAF